MVQAFLQDRKHLTRRSKGLDLINQHPRNWMLREMNELEGTATFTSRKNPQHAQIIHCPYGQAGDRVCIRNASAHMQPGHPADQKARLDQSDHHLFLEAHTRPQDAVELWRIIRHIHVSRILEITEEEARDEGVELVLDHGQSLGWVNYAPHSTILCGTARESFFSLWDFLHDSWLQQTANNPYLWVIRLAPLSSSSEV